MNAPLRQKSSPVEGRAKLADQGNSAGGPTELVELNFLAVKNGNSWMFFHTHLNKTFVLNEPWNVSF